MSLRNILFVLVILLSQNILAQQETTVHQVVLTDGNVLRGKLLVSNDPQIVEIKTFSGALFRIDRQHVKEVIYIKTDQKILDNGRTINQGKLYTNIFWGLHLGEEDTWDGTNLKIGFNALHFSMGHRFNQHLSWGAGISWDNFDVTLFSLFTEVRGYISEKTVSPYYALGAGYGIPLFNEQEDGRTVDLKGGYTLHPAIGFRIANRNSTNFQFEVGYRFQQTKQQIDNFAKILDTITYRRLSLRFGLDF